MSITERVRQLPYGQEVLDTKFCKTNTFGVYFKKVPKIGSSTISKVLMELLYPGITQIEYEKFNPHEKTSPHYWLHVSSPPLLEVDLGDELLSKAALFTFCRNPYARLLSYYKNKFNGFLDEGEFEYIKHLRRSVVYHAANEGWFTPERVFDEVHGISFEAFVRFVCRPEAPSDFHWRPQVWVTAAEVIPYRKIIRAENLNEELREVFRQYCHVDLELKERLNSSKDTNRLLFYTEELAEMVYEFYRKDFDFFSYEKDSWLSK